MVISASARSVHLNMNGATSLSATADTQPHAYARDFTMLAPHMAELDRFLHLQLAEFEPEIRPRAGNCIDTSGERIRPALVFLSGWQGAAEVAPDLVRVAAVVELIHLATRVHANIAGEADPTPSVLLGDAFFAHALHLATQFPTTEICAAITESTRRVCTGEIVQTLRRGSTDITRAVYQRIVELKTTELFRVSCLLGARLANSEPGYVEAANRFGRHLGTAYHIYDDLADFFGEGTRTGKTSGTDLATGKLTLPLLTLLECLPSTEADTLRAEIVRERPPQHALRLRQIREHAIFPIIADAVQVEIAAATEALREWHDHPPTPLLLGLCDVLQARLAGLQPAATA